MTTLTAPTARAVRNPINLVWVALVVTTLVSWWLGADHTSADLRELATAGVIVLAFVKVQLVGTYFMEVRHAPRVLQLLFSAWCVAVGGGLVLMYLLS